MFNWLRRKLGIADLEREVADLADVVWRLEYRTGKIQKKIRTGKRSQRYDEIERGKKRRRKGKVDADVF